MPYILRILILFGFLFPQIGKGQLIDDIFNADHGNVDNVPLYLSPLNDMYGASIHSGIFPRYSEKGFHIQLGIHGARISVSENMSTYNASIKEDQILVPTILGDGEPVAYSDGGLETVFPGGLDIMNMTIAMPELYIGTLYGTDFYGRYAQVPLKGELGKLELMGGGIRHDFGRYFFPEYIKWYLSYSFHQMSTGEKFSSVNHYGLTQLGVKLNRIGIYGLFGYELNDMQYHYIVNEQKVSTGLNEVTPLRFGGGVNLTFKYIDFFGEYNMIDPVNIIFGIAVGI